MTDSFSLKIGGDSGPVIVPGDPDSSPLYHAVTYLNRELAMPPSGRLTDQQIKDIRTWIEMGATDPRIKAAASNEPGEFDPWLDPNGKGREHWAYVPMQVHSPREVDTGIAA